MAVLVPCFNEEKDILAKLEDIRGLNYPRDRLRVIFADGGSTDATVAILEGNLRPDEPYEILRCQGRGKIAQLNEALQRCEAEIVVNTDADARLDPEALRWLAAEFAAAPEAAVVGAYCRPAQAMDLEIYYWDAQNKGRLLESDAGSASIVVAPCYAFRRQLLTALPEDVVADDVYVSFLAHAVGQRVIYSRQAQARELRAPRTSAEFLAHKFRKSNAYLRESLRFLYRLPDMPAFAKILFFTRVAQQLVLPWLTLFWLLTVGSLLTLFRVDVALACCILLGALFLATSRIFAHVRLPDTPKQHSFATMVRGYVLTCFILLATAIAYPFCRQGSVYQRLAPR
ncbi:MAG: glycosyltransferase [Planctomycetota bacterium]|nr:glycosyltransferase [Planctomycetota bacterium]